MLLTKRMEAFQETEVASEAEGSTTSKEEDTEAEETVNGEDAKLMASEAAEI